ncbi:unnamed protein product [Phytophthora fragariaefolia]|uniref:Unnamed protein product n=1 Tax=Phytophthora fragariaefolia TaxID=1490495 RepID=A0A9W7D677_9STRA|nr:unnamed protein product [Phytophthora fragariaefolia]
MSGIQQGSTTTWRHRVGHQLGVRFRALHDDEDYAGLQPHFTSDQIDSLAVVGIASLCSVVGFAFATCNTRSAYNEALSINFIIKASSAQALVNAGSLFAFMQGENRLFVLDHL